jgi:ABC-2 type transport system permease protein
MTAVMEGTRAPADLRDPGFAATLRSEWTKFASLRSVRVTLVLGVVLGIAVTGLLGWLIRATWDEWPAEERAAFSVLDTALVGMLLSGILFTVLGVTTVTSEYSSRMAGLTFTVTPRRERVLLAKVLVVAAATLVATLVAVTGMIALSLVVFADEPTPEAGRVVRLVLGIAANTAMSSVITVALAFMVRSAAGTVAAILGVTFGPLIIGPLLPTWWEEHGQRYLPAAAMDSLTLPSFSEPSALDTGPAALVVAAYLAAFVGGAWLALTRRDV